MTVEIKVNEQFLSPKFAKETDWQFKIKEEKRKYPFLGVEGLRR